LHNPITDSPAFAQADGGNGRSQHHQATPAFVGQSIDRQVTASFASRQESREVDAFNAQNSYSESHFEEM